MDFRKLQRRVVKDYIEYFTDKGFEFIFSVDSAINFYFLVIAIISQCTNRELYNNTKML